MNSKSWVLIFIIAIVIAGAVSFLILISLGAFWPDRRGLAFGDRVGVIEIEGTMITVTPAVDEIRFVKIAEEMNKYGVPLVEPLSAAVNVAVALVRLGLSQSKVSYPVPPERKRVF